MAFDIGSALISYALQKKALDSASDKTIGAAETQAEAIKEAAVPVSVFDPTGYAVYDEATKSYQLGLDPAIQGLFSQYFNQAARDLGYATAMTPEYIDTESARRAKENIDYITKGGEEALESALGRLYGKGTIGTKQGSRALADIGQTTAKNVLGEKERQRGLLTAELVDAINRAKGYQTSALGLTSQPISLSQIGRGTSGTLANATSNAYAPLTSAYQTGALAQNIPMFSLGQAIGDYSPTGTTGGGMSFFGTPVNFGV